MDREGEARQAAVEASRRFAADALGGARQAVTVRAPPAMIRVVLYLVIVGLLAFGAVWLADRPGDVLITWQNRRIETSVMVLMVAVAAIAVLTVAAVVDRCARSCARPTCSGSICARGAACAAISRCRRA